MNRFDTMTYLLNRRKVFKLVCGAGNEDAEEVMRLVFVYTLAGAKVFDVSANIDVVKKAMQGIDRAIDHARAKHQDIFIRPYVSVSIGMKGDPHARKAKITAKCTRCGDCIQACPMKAIAPSLEVLEKRCIGCGHCEAVCAFGAVTFYHHGKNLKQILLNCRKAGMEQLELHAAVADSDAVFEEWKMVNDVAKNQYVSICLDRLHLGDSQLTRRIRKAKETAGDRLIVQADGVPMSGGQDDYNTTLQAIAIADIVRKSKIPVKVLLSGGTNSLTAKLAKMCGVDFNGIAIGTFARNIVGRNLQGKDFWKTKTKISNAVGIAKRLVAANIGDPIW